MKISEAISRMQFALKQIGDLDFGVMTKVDGRYIFEFDRPIDIVEMKIDGRDVKVVVAMPDESLEREYEAPV